MDIILKNVKVPKGYKTTGEYREAKAGEVVLDSASKASVMQNDSSKPHIILEKEHVAPVRCWSMDDEGKFIWVDSQNSPFPTHPGVVLELVKRSVRVNNLPEVCDFIKMSYGSASPRFYLGYWNDGPVKGETKS